ncbi:nickel pincer cofactor biosynthesis protein LarB [Apilactobacillus sp. TMW 2.2459]|uniref:nickel pincer cofactor biosynthesis protein LarB n=1 Tax=Apilactobacillus xinyiensis TaxID=2841032 RepID=UPI00200DC586|nr:nickel pincer cofactor biosynthesis protein LarB [Apilactobacillus xinyiensis]MCL0312142.1 nickel pincer cofactor biosynthesis protein LarB [Apilactobacillus xinyiensis]
MEINSEIEQLLKGVAQNDTSISDAIKQLQNLQSADLGYAKVDLSRKSRNGYPEVIYGAGKTPTQIIEIMKALKAQGENVLCTRVSHEKYQEIKLAEPNAKYFSDAQCIQLIQQEISLTSDYIAVVTAGTSDVPVAEEAAITAQMYGNRVKRIYDVGVAGIHRLFEHLDEIRKAKVVIVVAGMEGALVSVVGGLINAPLIAVPTSIGYGTNFGGLTALMTMLNSCASGITVVNVDNGFGAGYSASLMNHLGVKENTD